MVLDGRYWKDAIARHCERVDEVWVREVLTRYREQGITHLRDGGDAWGVGLFAKEIAGEYGIVYRTPAFPIYKVGHYGGFIGKGFSDFHQYKALVLEAKASGADFIKVMISGLMDFEQFGGLSCEPLEKSEIAQMIAFAHDLGMAVMAHANGARTVQAAAELGCDSIEHGAYLDDEAIACMAQSNTIWVPTISTIQNLIGCGRHADAVLQRIRDLHAENIHKAAKFGAMIAVGSDAGAFCVPHSKGTMDEEGYLLEILGDGAWEILLRGNQAIFERF